MKEEVLPFYAYSVGPCSASVCTSLKSRKAIEVKMNAEHPTGISSSWEIAKEKTFADGKPMPRPCDQNPKTHKHYLLRC